MKSEVFWHVFFVFGFRKMGKCLFCFHGKLENVLANGTIQKNGYQFLGFLALSRECFRIYAFYWPNMRRFTRRSLLEEGKEGAAGDYSGSPKIPTMSFVWKRVIFIFFSHESALLRVKWKSAHFCVILRILQIFSCILASKKNVNQLILGDAKYLVSRLLDRRPSSGDCHNLLKGSDPLPQSLRSPALIWINKKRGSSSMFVWFM